MIDFFPEEHKQTSDKRRFGICDTPPPPAIEAYIDEANGQNWIAVVDNFYQDSITFIPGLGVSPFISSTNILTN